MSVTLWRIATDALEYRAHDLCGRGAGKSGGRWNRRGRPVVYASATIALACLESVVHLNTDGLPLNGFLVHIEVPDEVWANRDTSALSTGWSEIPQGKASMDFGDTWLKSKKSALLAVPSAIVPLECNVLINPAHPDAAHISAKKIRPWFYDQRRGELAPAQTLT
jgi:RES domain-containing protein